MALNNRKDTNKYDANGRSDFHQELLKELEAKGGAPVLLYPPDK